MISSFIPVVSGRRTIFAGSFPAITAAACITRPPPDPLTTTPASAPHISANTFPTALFSSPMSTITFEVFCITSATSGRSFDPPHIVVVPDALIMGRTPSESYISTPLNDKSIPFLKTQRIRSPRRDRNYTTCPPIAPLPNCPQKITGNVIPNAAKRSEESRILALPDQRTPTPNFLLSSPLYALRGESSPPSVIPAKERHPVPRYGAGIHSPPSVISALSAVNPLPRGRGLG